MIDSEESSSSVIFNLRSQHGPGGTLEQQDVERIARAAMKELGAHGAVLTIRQEAQPGHWRIDIQGGHGPDHLKIKCGQGSSAQWVREQIFEQYLA
jgi:hypothetical protein